MSDWTGTGGAAGASPAVTIDYSTNRGKVRLIITDTDVTSLIFTDAEIDAFLGMHDDVVFLAAAQALDTIASNEALVSKVIKLLDLSTNGAAVAGALRTHANSLREQVNNEASFDYAEMAVDAFSARELIYKETLRG